MKNSARPWYRRIGPGLITACVVIGPGSILTSSTVGAANGYGMSWVVLVAVLCMLTFMSLGARLGAVAAESNGTLLAERVGRWVAVVIGASVFFISAAYQFGNNLGVLAAIGEVQSYVAPESRVPSDVILVILNGLAISFLFAMKNFYRFVERLMMILVAIMLVSFAINLGFARPPLSQLLRGMVPPMAPIATGMSSLLAAWWNKTPVDSPTIDLSVLALVGTTFVITAAYFQSYLVRQKGWKKADVEIGLIDVRIGVFIMAAITIMIMSTGAAVLRGQSLGTVADVAAGLKPAFGATGHILFCLGLFSAAYSSFIVNSMIGGFILSDGLGYGSEPHQWMPRLLTAVVLLIGMVVAIAVHRLNWSPVPAIISAQAVTVVASPLVAASLWWLTTRRDIMGDQRNGIGVNIAAGCALLMLLAMAGYTAVVKVLPQIASWR